MEIYLNHISDPKFLIDEDLKWKRLKEEWPYVFYSVFTDNSSFDFRFELNQYPALAPCCTLWDMKEDLPIKDSERPSNTAQQSMIFKNWERGLHLYHPMERKSSSHFNGGYEDLYWDSKTHTITSFLEVLFDLLNPNQYD